MMEMFIVGGPVGMGFGSAPYWDITPPQKNNTTGRACGLGMLQVPALILGSQVVTVAQKCLFPV